MYWHTAQFGLFSVYGLVSFFCRLFPFLFHRDAPGLCGNSSLPGSHINPFWIVELELSYDPVVLGLAWRWQAVFGYGGSWTGKDRRFCGCGIGLVGAEVTLVLNNNQISEGKTLLPSGKSFAASRYGNHYIWCRT